MSREQRLGRVFVELADTLVDDFDAIDLLYVLCERSIGLLPVDAAGLIFADQRGQLQVMASTTEEARVLELFVLQNSEGPCLDCYATGQPQVNIDPREAEARWPHFRAATIGLLQERTVRQSEIIAEQLQNALNSRILIEQAKGVLAERAGISVDEAFAQIRSWARGHRLRLQDTAQAVIDGTSDLVPTQSD